MKIFSYFLRQISYQTVFCPIIFNTSTNIKSFRQFLTLSRESAKYLYQELSCTALTFLCLLFKDNNVSFSLTTLCISRVFLGHLRSYIFLENMLLFLKNSASFFQMFACPSCLCLMQQLLLFSFRKLQKTLIIFVAFYFIREQFSRLILIFIHRLLIMFYKKKIDFLL